MHVFLHAARPSSVHCFGNSLWMAHSLTKATSWFSHLACPPGMGSLRHSSAQESDGSESVRCSASASSSGARHVQTTEEKVAEPSRGDDLLVMQGADGSTDTTDSTSSWQSEQRPFDDGYQDDDQPLPPRRAGVGAGDFLQSELHLRAAQALTPLHSRPASHLQTNGSQDSHGVLRRSSSLTKRRKKPPEGLPPMLGGTHAQPKLASFSAAGDQDRRLRVASVEALENARRAEWVADSAFRV